MKLAAIGYMRNILLFHFRLDLKIVLVQYYVDRTISKVSFWEEYGRLYVRKSRIRLYLAIYLPN